MQYQEYITMLPRHMRAHVLAWIERAVPPGHFLSAVIRNNLALSYAHADPQNKEALQAYSQYFFNYAPSDCWGSDEAFEYWHRVGGLVGLGLLDTAATMTTLRLDDRAILTTEHAASNHGLPVLVRDGQAYGPADPLQLSGDLTGADYVEAYYPAGGAPDIVRDYLLQHPTRREEATR